MKIILGFPVNFIFPHQHYFSLPLNREPQIKRTICRRCNVRLVPGITAAVRLQRKFLLDFTAISDFEHFDACHKLSNRSTTQCRATCH